MPSIDPLPPCFLKGRQYVRKKQRVQHVVMDKQGMADFVTKHIERELAIELRAIKEMADEIVAIRDGVGLRLFLLPLTHALVHVPVRCIDGNVANTVTMFLEQRAEPIALLGSVSFFQKWITKEPGNVAIRLDDRFISQNVRRKVVVACLLHIHL